MLIGVLSDTHLVEWDSMFLGWLETHLAHVDGIIHAGDFISAEVYQKLSEYKPLYSVQGNVDDSQLKGLLKEKEIVKLADYNIGVFHGHGELGKTIDRVWEVFREDDVDIIIFGHSHQPLMKTRGGRLLLNPGSCSNKRRERWYSCIILDISQGHLEVKFNLF